MTKKRLLALWMALLLAVCAPLALAEDVATPSEAEEPVALTTPETPETPDVTETADETETPDETVTADVTETPDVTETADETVTADETETPDATTETPDEPETPEEPVAEALTAVLTGPEQAKAGVEEMTFTVAPAGGTAPYAVAWQIVRSADVVAESTTQTEGTASIPYTAKTYGQYTFTAVVTDAAGAQTTQSVTVAVSMVVDENTDLYWNKHITFDRSGSWREDILSAAHALEGKSLSDIRFSIAPNGERSTSEGDWCTLFVRFALKLAGISENDFPRDGSAEKWVEELEEMAAFAPAGFVPQKGDLVFLEEEGKAEHVGIVTRVGDTQMKVLTVEASTVTEKTLSLSDSAICGFADVDVLLIAAGRLAPKAEDSTADETITDETVTDETIVDETIVDETVTDETVIDETVTDETVVDEPVALSLPLLTASDTGAVITTQGATDGDTWFLLDGEAWQELGVGAGVEVGLSRVHILSAYRCVRDGVPVAEGVAASEELAAWLTDDVTDEMLSRALKAQSLDSLLLEGDVLYSVRTGAAVADLDETDTLVDRQTGLSVATVVDGAICPISAEE